MRFLVVDDQSTNRAILKWLLEDEGHEVIEAADGRQAVEAFQSKEVDFVLMDVMMPVMDGHEATRKIKELKTDGSYVPVIFLTAVDDDDALRKCLECGGDDFLGKPYNESVLKAKISAHIRIRELTQQLTEKNRELIAHNSRWQREQNIVKHIFTTALQHNLSDCSNLKSYVSPATTFNGDILLSTPSPSGGLYVFLGDFTGHGLGASIGTLPIAHSFEQMAKRHMSVGEIASEFNQMLNYMLPDYMFCAAFILELSAAGDSIQVWIGGLPDGYLLKEDGTIKEKISSRNMPLGVEHREKFNNGFEVKHLHPGERVFFYTDGLDEAENPEGEFFGHKRLEECFESGCSGTLNCVLDRLNSFIQEAPQRDDITIVEVSAGPVEIKSEADKTPETYEGLLWKLNTTATLIDIKRANPVEEIMSVLGEQTVLRPYRDVIGLLLAELYSNSLEHGILKLSSDIKRTEDGFLEYYKQRTIRLNELNYAQVDFYIELVHLAHPVLKIRVEDSGEGFDFDSILESGHEDSFGRGMALINRVCSRVEYSNGGRCVEVDFPINATSYID